MSDIVLNNGGTIDKFVGDAVVAFWGAPIARPMTAGMPSRRPWKCWISPVSSATASDRAMIGRTRVGLHYGEAIVGNFGGEGRISYTALGDSMNTAARRRGRQQSI